MPSLAFATHHFHLLWTSSFVATQKFALSHFHRRMYAVSSILSAFASKNTERKEEMRAFKTLSPPAFSYPSMPEWSASLLLHKASFRKERRCVFYCTLFRFIVPSFTVFLFALGDWRRRNFRFFFSYFRIYDKQKNKQTRKLKVSFRKKKKRGQTCHQLGG